MFGTGAMASQKELVARIKRSKTRPGLSRSLTIRLPNELYDKLDAYAGKLAAELPGVDLTVTARFESQGGDRRFRFGWAKRCTMRRMVASVTIASETSGSSS